MKKSGLAILISCILGAQVFAEDINYQQLLNERNISALEKIIIDNPNDAEAYYMASIYYGVGDDDLGSNKDVDKKDDYLKKAAHLGYPEAEMQYGFTLLNAGKSEEGLEYIKRAANQKYLQAVVMLGDLYYAGYQDKAGDNIVQQDLAQSIVYLTQAMELGSQDARYTLGHLYLDKDLGYYDLDKSLKLFEDNLDYANKTGHLPTIITLIGIYESNEVGANRGKLLDYYYLASLQEYAPSFYTIGVLQREGDQGDQLVIEKDPEAAFVNLSKAAGIGYIDAMFRISEMYFKGEGVEQSDVNAYVWLAIAEDLSGSDSNYSETILELIPKRQRQIAIDNKNHYRQFFSMPEESTDDQSVSQ